MGNSEVIYAYSVFDPRSVSFSQLEKTEELPYRKIWACKLTGDEYEEYSVFSGSNRSVEE